MLITTLQEEAVNECLRHNIPFVIYALPDCDRARFMASLPDDSGESHAPVEDAAADSFFISRFASDEPYMAGVVSDMDEAALIDWVAAHPEARFDGCQERPYLTSTRRVSYDEAFRVMTRRLRKDGGKVVLSRHKSLFSATSVTATADEYFSSMPGAFRYMSFTPETGLWLGATPELLLETVPGSDELRSMALAGTLPGDGNDAWNSKNLDEHLLVVKFISDVLASHGLEVDRTAPADLHTGTVTHLCTHITGRGTVRSAGAIINDLNPTPAVAGWPRPIAIAEIDALETHQRRCYSGIVGVRTEGRLHVFVNLRCAFIAPATLDGHDGWVYNIYAGGGLMPHSTLDEEWDETSRKMQTLYNCLHDITENPIEAQF